MHIHDLSDDSFLHLLCRHIVIFSFFISSPYFPAYMIEVDGRIAINSKSNLRLKERTH